MLGVLLGVVARLWLATLRVRVEVDPALEAVADRPWILSFLHGSQFPLLAWKRRRRTVVMVSLSKDGRMQARALAMLGMEIVRGSSSRGGARGLTALVRALRGGERDAAFAVDGPRGPYGEPKPGAVLAARRSGGVLVPMGSAMVRGMMLARAWDRFRLPWPFTRVTVVLGAPVEAAGEWETVRETLSTALQEAERRAHGLLPGAVVEVDNWIGVSRPLNRS